MHSNLPNSRPVLLPLLPRLLRLTALLIGFAGLSGLARAQTQPTWTNVAHGLDAGYESLASVAFGNGVFVAIAGTPIPTATGPAVPVRITTSTDGLTWTARSLNNTLFRPYVSRVRFLNGRFVVAYGGQTAADFASPSANFYATSTDGVTWTNIAQPTTAAFTELIFANGRYYNVGSAITSSADLTTWTTHPTPLTGIFSYLDIAFGNGRFFATTNGAGGTVTSTDGTNWTQVPFFAQLGGYRVEFLDGTWFFYSQGNNAVSTDGTTFTTVVRGNGPGGTATILAVNGRYLAPGAGNYQAGLNGRDWATFGLTPTISGSIFNGYVEVAFGAGRYVAVGSGTTGRANFPLIITLAETDAPPLVFPVAPAIAAQPKAQTISPGGTAVFSVTATAATSYQWRLGTTNVQGATSANLVIRNATAANAGSYSCVVTNAFGTATSAVAALTLNPTPDFGRLINLSILTAITATEPLFTVGTVIGGAGTTGTKPLLIRAVGPSLAPLGVASPLADPRLEIFTGQTSVGSNDNWGGDTALANVFAGVGAFGFLNAASRDSAAYNPATVPAGYTIQVTGVGGATGPVIAELYDATPASAFVATTPRLVNVSVLKTIPAGSLLTAGFVISGSTAKTVLIRAIGPGLARPPFNVPGAMADPKLDLLSGQTVLASNDNWGGDAQLTTVGTAVGAFAITDAASKDAMLLVTLAPGGYTTQATGVGSTGGAAIVEVYEVP
ncbi:MAG: hypothetical protein RLZZ15_2053 [Verrucomicrobiota bacterium]